MLDNVGEKIFLKDCFYVEEVPCLVKEMDLYTDREGCSVIGSGGECVSYHGDERKK